MIEEKTSPPIQCLVRAMDILKLIAENDVAADENSNAGNSPGHAKNAPSGLGVTEIASRSGLHVATTHNILRTLTSGGFLVNAAGRYHIGDAAAKLSLSYRPLATLTELVEKPMAAMSRTIGELGVLAVLTGDACRMRSVSAGNREITVAAYDRTYENPLAVACGRLLAATCRQDQWPQLIEAHQSAGHSCDDNAMMAELATIAAEGCCIIRRPRPDGVDAVAVALHGADGQIVAALGVSCPNFRNSEDHIKAMLLSVSQAACDSSAALGYKANLLSEQVINNAVARSFATDTLAIMR